MPKTTVNMTRKHFEMIAEVIRDERSARNKAFNRAVENHPNSIQQEFERGRVVGATEFAYRMADALASTNPNFDRDRFIEACEPKQGQARVVDDNRVREDRIAGGAA